MTTKRSFKPVEKQTLAEQAAAHIEASIVSGTFQGGDALPTEPELARQFGVSRAVVRDATRMLAARGLVEVRHGKGVFVTHTQTTAFGEALLLALRRMDASNWDVAHFEQLLYPEIAALAAASATEEDLAAMQSAADSYLALHARSADSGLPAIESAAFRALRQSWSDFVQAMFDATHNRVISLLAQPLIGLHGPRDWQGLPGSITEEETAVVATIIEAVRSRDPDHAREEMRSLLTLPAEAVAALKGTAVGETTTIVVERER